MQTTDVQGDSTDVVCHACGWRYERSTPLLTCSRCGHAYRPFTGDPIEFHAHQYRKDFRFHRSQGEFDANGRPNKRFHRARRSIVKKREKLIREFLSCEKRCLDIGAGGGTFAAQIRRRVQSVECLEVDPSLVAECQRLGFKTYKNDFLNQRFDRPYDVVFGWHVLEHIPDAQVFVDKAVALARQYFILEIPVNRRVPEQFDGHYHYFSMPSLRLMLHEPRVIRVQEGVQKPSLLAIVQGAAT